MLLFGYLEGENVFRVTEKFTLESQQTRRLSNPTERARASLMGLKARSVAGLQMKLTIKPSEKSESVKSLYLQ